MNLESSSTKMESSLPELYNVSLVSRPVPPSTVAVMDQDVLSSIVENGNQVPVPLPSPFLQKKPGRKPPQ